MQEKLENKNNYDRKNNHAHNNRKNNLSDCD